MPEFGPEPKYPIPLLKEVNLPQKTFFYIRLDGRIFVCEEQEAANVHEYYTSHGRFLGSSDGKTYYNLMLKAIETQNAAIKKLDKDMRDAKTKLRMFSMRPKLTKKQEKEMEFYITVEENYEDLRREIYDQTVLDRKAAEDAELEKARGNLVPPANMDYVYMTPQGGTQATPNRIDDLINQQ